MKSRRRKYVLLGAIAALVAILAAAALSRVTHTTSYDPSTGRLRVVVTYELAWGGCYKLTVLALRDSVFSTGVSEYLAAHGASRNGPSEWRGYSASASGPQGYVSHSRGAPRVLSPLAWATFRALYEPLLSETEFIGLLRLALDPEDNPAVRGLFEPSVYTPLVELRDTASKRELVKKKLGQFWFKYVEGSGGKPVPMGK